MQSIQRQMLGISLIELMLALTLSLILILGLYRILLSNSAIYRQHTVVGYLHENAQLATQLISHDIRMAGLLGCTTLAKANRFIQQIPNLSTDMQLHSDNSLQLYRATDGAWTPALPDNIGNHISADSDVLIIQKIDEHSASLAEPKLDSQNELSLVVGSPIFRVGQTVMLADCNQAELFSIQATSQRNQQQQITLNPPNQTSDHNNL